MCRITAAGKEAAVARFLQESTSASRAESDHPELRGCDGAWTDAPECPARVPALPRGLLDPVAAQEAERVLCIVLMDSPFSMGPAMPTAPSSSPSHRRSAVGPSSLSVSPPIPATPVRAGLVEVLLVVAELSHPVYGGSEQATPFLGNDRDHPERVLCRAVFAEQADLARGLLDDRTLPDGLIPPGERRSHLTVATP